ncbi:UDP-2,4-diacetamido-2,4,6-trideoxy-beta-L-altropyranose hydrolase [Campylobacter sp. 9BO]|uniref:UDP-2,4-diacetamido-2,4, 6-trideoxy-beta-L-altropyranose hydrolase n=1 Tax=Campylobacter sp. 9BO TaxID=3424759 RepID=UPI003D3282EB
MFKKISHLKTLIRADSSDQIGHGHIRRNLVMAAKFSDVSFACVRLNGDIFNEINYPKFELKTSEISEFIELINMEKFELVVIDHYGIDFDNERAICEQTDAKILCFDDCYGKHYCDILLNVNLFAERLKYATLVPYWCEVWCGREYMLVRDEFYQEQSVKREKIYDFFIGFGGTDILNLSFKIAEILLAKSAKIALITTSANTNLTELKNLSDENENLSLFINSDQIAKLMNESQNLIIQASGFVNEALVLGANFTAVKTADNQNELYKWLKTNGFKAYVSEQICKILS